MKKILLTFLFCVVSLATSSVYSCQITIENVDTTSTNMSITVTRTTGEEENLLLNTSLQPGQSTTVAKQANLQLTVTPNGFQSFSIPLDSATKTYSLSLSKPEVQEEGEENDGEIIVELVIRTDKPSTARYGLTKADH